MSLTETFYFFPFIMSTPSAITIQRFGEKLRRLRVQHGLTLKEMAVALNLSAHGYLSELEAGKKQPTGETILKVARLFNVTADELLVDALELRGITPSDKHAINFPVLAKHPTENDVERLRLVLSTYQDGSGMQAMPSGGTLPGWRDFERSVAAVFGGQAQESKSIFDVLIPDPQLQGVVAGVSCKMRGELRRVVKGDGRVTLELSNSAKKFWDFLGTKGIHQSNYKFKPDMVGAALVELVHEWHSFVALESGGKVDMERSCFLSLSWRMGNKYQLHQFPLTLPTPESLDWSVPAGSICGVDDKGGTVLQWYGESGGQLKYFPLAIDALWQSPLFELEPLPDTVSSTLLHRTEAYFPALWAAVANNE